MSKKVSSSNFSIQVGGDTVMFKMPLFENDGEYQNIDKWLRVDVNNLVGELVVTPLILNRFGILLAEAEDLVRIEKMNYETWEAKTIKAFRDERAENGEKNPTKPEIDEHIILHALRKFHYKKLLERQKTESYIKSIYWSFKEKQENLKKLSLTLQQGDLDTEVIQSALRKLKDVEHVKIS